MRDQIETQMRVQAHLIRLLQTITLYVDTKDRSANSGVHVLNEAIDALSDGWLKRWESLEAREQRFNARVASIDDLRASVTLAQQTSLTLKREVERLLERQAPGPRPQAPGDAPKPQASSPTPESDLDAFKYLGFEDEFRGSREEIRSRLASYLPLFEGQRDVLDIGCGRGEFLDLLRERGIPARGLDSNHEMVETSRARGLDVAEGDALTYLRSLPDASLGGVFAAQVAEHLEPSYLMRLIEAAYHKVRPGGLLILETINPACWVAFFESYIRDLTHVRPLHPETLQYLMRAHGFHDVTIEFKAPIAEAARLQSLAAAAGEVAPAIADLVDTFNENVAKLNARMFTYQDYAAIGRR
jgi:O-antigen chain-terminating methyltransferase